MNIRVALGHKLLLSMAACAAMFAFGHNANALTMSVGDSHELGYLWPGVPSGNQNAATYVNHMAGMALGAIDVGNGQIYFRSWNSFGSLHAAASVLNGTSTNINLGTGGLYTYLFANYGVAGAEVWYVGNLTGSITIPGMNGLSRLSGWTLLRSTGVGVPDGGVTAIMLGLAFCALAVSRRLVTT